MWGANLDRSRLSGGSTFPLLSLARFTLIDLLAERFHSRFGGLVHALKHRAVGRQFPASVPQERSPGLTPPVLRSHPRSGRRSKPPFHDRPIQFRLRPEERDCMARFIKNEKPLLRFAGHGVPVVTPPLQMSDLDRLSLCASQARAISSDEGVDMGDQVTPWRLNFPFCESCRRETWHDD